MVEILVLQLLLDELVEPSLSRATSEGLRDM
jgi:hypothetical protein